MRLGRGVGWNGLEEVRIDGVTRGPVNVAQGVEKDG